MSKSMILIVLTLASTGASAFFWNELRTERQVSQRLEARLARLEQTDRAKPVAPAPQVQLPPAPEPLVETERPASSVTESKTPPQARPVFQTFAANAFGVSRSADPELQRRMQEQRDQQRRMLQNPEYRELMRAQHRESMNHVYGDLEVLMGITSEQAEQLRDLLADQQVRRMEDAPSFIQADGSPNDQVKVREYQERQQQIQSKNEQEIASLLGPNYSDWQSYQQNAWSRSTVMNLKQNLASSNEPLRADQIKPLVDAIAREQQRILQPTRNQVWNPQQMDSAARVRMQEEFLERTAQSNERVRNAVNGLLSPAQLEQLTRQQDQQLRMQQLNLKMLRAREEAQARGEIPPDNANANAMISVDTYAGP